MPLSLATYDFSFKFSSGFRDSLVHTPALVYVGLMALPSIGPEICVASLITGIHHTSLVVRVAISAFGEYFCRMNEIAAFFGNYPLLNMFLQRFVITSINTSSQSTTTSCYSVWRHFS
ncbi:hypothetical protein T07_7088, partial [Trichinella nelsoni]